MEMSSQVYFCSTGEDSPSVVDIRRIKTSVPTVFYENESEAVYDFPSRERWTMFVRSCEVIHEDSCHFIWDFHKRHGEDYDCLMMPIYDQSKNCIEESPRILSERVMSGNFFNGDFSVPDWSRKAPASLFPKPTWRMCEGYVVPGNVPKFARHLVGRTKYSEIHIIKKMEIV
jgi:hypothetical protein